MNNYLLSVLRIYFIVLILSNNCLKSQSQLLNDKRNFLTGMSSKVNYKCDCKTNFKKEYLLIDSVEILIDTLPQYLNKFQYFKFSFVPNRNNNLKFEGYLMKDNSVIKYFKDLNSSNGASIFITDSIISESIFLEPFQQLDLFGSSIESITLKRDLMNNYLVVYDYSSASFDNPFITLVTLSNQSIVNFNFYDGYHNYECFRINE